MAHYEDVAIFWDYENCHEASSVSGYEVASNIRRVAHNFGSVKLFKAYLELSEPSSSKSVNLRSELQSSGVSLTDCPHNGKKNVADMMILDMMAYAIDHPGPATIILISGDRDFAYAVSVLRLRRYRVVIISLPVPGAHASLTAHASAIFDWNTDVMDKADADLHVSSARKTWLPTPPDTSEPLAAYPSPAPSFTRASRKGSSAERDLGYDLLDRTARLGTPTASPNAVKHVRAYSVSEEQAGSSTPRSTHGGRAVPSLPAEPDVFFAQKTPARSATLFPESAPSAAQPNGGPAVSPLIPANTTGDGSQADSAGKTPESRYTSNFLPPRLPMVLDALKATVQRPSTPADVQLAPSGVSLESAAGGPSDEKPTSPPAQTSTYTLPTVTPAPWENPTSNPDLRAQLPTQQGWATPKLPQKDISPPAVSPYQSSLRAFSLPDLRADADVFDPSKPVPTPALESGMSSISDPSSLDPSSAASSAAPLPEPTKPPALPREASFASGSASFQSHYPFVPPLPPPPVFQTEPAPAPEPRRLRPEFLILVEVLRNRMAEGLPHIERSTIAVDLKKRDQKVYSRAGVESFRQYTALAEKEGVVVMGQINKHDWISLHPDWCR